MGGVVEALAILAAGFWAGMINVVVGSGTAGDVSRRCCCSAIRRWLRTCPKRRGLLSLGGVLCQRRGRLTGRVQMAHELTELIRRRGIPDGSRPNLR